MKYLLQWLLNRICKDVCMESTDKYRIFIYNILESDCSLVLVHPEYVKAIRGKETAKWTADLFKHDLVAESFMPPADIRQLRDLIRYRFKLTCFKSSEKNRLQKLEELIPALAVPCQQDLTILQTVLGIISIFTAIGIISEIDINMEAFSSAKHLCSWTGLTPN